MTRYLFIVLIAALTLNTGCKLIYKQNVQQGNAHEQEDLDQLELGMTKKQVAYLLGTPAVHDPFHQDRWDYISMLSRRGGEPVRRLVRSSVTRTSYTMCRSTALAVGSPRRVGMVDCGLWMLGVAI